ncbi:MAG: amidohydrolase family protein [Anaerolineales bacterium]|nr:amidohydrolase family protein [Anaerolineales bacterium]
MTTACDLLLTNAIILTMDERYTRYAAGAGAVAVTGDSVVAVGPYATRFTAKETLDCGGKALLPGLVNAHTHAPMTLLRGLADDLRLDVWLLGYMMPVEREFVSTDFVRLGTGLACAEMIRSGVTSFADMYYFEAGVAEAAATAGMRAVCGQTVLKFPTPDADSFEDSLALAREFIIQWQGHPLIVPAVSPHAPYTCTPEILRACAQLAAEFDVPLHTHLSETLLEVENSRKDHGMPVVPWVKRQGLFEAKVLAAHCVHIDEGEIRTLKNAGAGVAHNPTSNLKLASGVAPVVAMLNQGLNVGLGTDGPASNNDLDMFSELHLAAILAKGMSSDPTALPARQALAMATRLGARALHIGHLTGSIEAGKRADLILVDLAALHNSPRFERDPNGVYAQLVYAAKASDVTDVMCNGRWLMRERTLLTLDTQDLALAARDYARRIDAFLIEREQSVLQKLIAIGGAVEQESFEVQVKARLAEDAKVLEVIGGEAVAVLRSTRYHEYDTYFLFDDPAQGRLRFREDEIMDADGEVTNTRTRLTLTGAEREQKAGSVLLSRSRYLAPATHTLRFYREYFKPSLEREIEKERRRWLVAYRGEEFYVNLDRVLKPALPGYYVEIKARTWSRRDADNKAGLIGDLLALLGASAKDTVKEEYVDLVA